MGARMTQWTEVDVDITVDEVVDFIESYADFNDLEDIKAALKNANFPSKEEQDLFKSDDGGYIREEKLELLSRAFSKYTLDELEKRLGTKFDLI